MNAAAAAHDAQRRELNELLAALRRWTKAEPKAEPVYQRGVETRKRIVQSARQAFVKRGYVDCAVEDILQEAGISRGTFYAHFRSKNAVFAAVVEEHLVGRLDQTRVPDMRSTPYEERVRATVARFLGNYARTQDFSMVIEQAAHYDPAFMEVRLAIRDMFARRIERGIVRQQEAGKVDSDLSARTAAAVILSMMTNVAQVEVGWRRRRPDEKLIDTLTHFWLRGLGLA